MSRSARVQCSWRRRVASCKVDEPGDEFFHIDESVKVRIECSDDIVNLVVSHGRAELLNDWLDLIKADVDTYELRQVHNATKLFYIDIAIGVCISIGE